MLLMRGCFTGSVTSFCLRAADCTGCFQKATGDLIDLPRRRPRAGLGQGAAEGAPSASRPGGSRVDDVKLFCIHVFIVKRIFQVWKILHIFVS